LLGLLPFLSQQGWSQTLEGLVRTPEGTPVPYARVSVVGADRGALSNEQGAYRLSLAPGRYPIECRHLGFAAQETTLNLEAGKRYSLDFTLTPVDWQMATVEIEGGKKDPAYAIMAEVIAHKRAFQQQYERYRCDTYLKVRRKVATLASSPVRVDSVSGDTLPPEDSIKTVDLIESFSETYFERPNRYQSVVKAYRHDNPERSKSIATAWDGVGEAYRSELTNPYLFYTDVSQADFNFYDNLIQAPSLGDRPFISPLNSTMWRLIYRYRLLESYLEQGRVHYRIEVKPRNEVGPYFSGELVVIDGLWAIESVDFEVMPATLSYFAAFHLSHRYEPDEQGRWLLREERYQYLVKERKEHHHGLTVALHRNYAVDIEWPSSFLGSELRRTEREAFERDSSYWAELRPIGLDPQEVAFSQEQDSLIERYSQAEYLHEIDSAYNHLGFWDILFNGMAFRDRPRRMHYYINSLLQQAQFYGVGGYRHALGGRVSKTFRRGTQLSVGGEVDYGFANEDLRGKGRVRYTYAPRRFARATLKGGNTYELITLNTSFTAIFSRSNFLNKVYGGAEHRMELVNGLFLDVGFEFADYRAIDQLQLAEWGDALFGDLNQPRAFDPFRQLRFDIELSYTPRQLYYLEPYRKVIKGSVWPTFTLKYRKAVPGVLGSDINYDFLALEVKHEFPVGAIGTSRWRTEAGRYLQAERIRLPDEVFFRGSDPFIFVNPLQVFQLLDSTMNTRNAYFSGHYLHDFGGTLIDKVPLLKRLPLQTTLGGGMLLMEDGSFWHNEVFAGLQVPFRIKRQRFKAGVFYVSSYSNSANAIGSQWKVGFTWFNGVKNEWEY
jgi:hypothetical protein